MPSDTAATAPVGVHTARCYCGASRLRLHGAPRVVSYCHCSDCRRWTGAPVAAFAGFAASALETDLEATFGPGKAPSPGVARWHCPDCGSPLAARFDYLPGQVYIPVGILDDVAELSPRLHSHFESALPWLHLADDLPRASASARTSLHKG